MIPNITGFLAITIPIAMAIGIASGLNPVVCGLLVMLAAKHVIRTDKIYAEFGPYSHAVRVGDMIFLHGAVGLDPSGQLPGSIPGRADMAGKCAQTLDNVATALDLLGGSV